MPISVCVFDAYGTLFDVAAPARRFASEPGREALGEVWPRLAELWRLKQLQYTWLRAAAGVHADFERITRDGLDWAAAKLAQEGTPLADADRDALMDVYFEIDAYPEVPEMLAGLKADGRATAILSNGTPRMLRAASASAGIADRLDALLSVESVGVFKPDPAVYALVGRRFGVPAGEVLFVSSNPWDAAAATGFGFRTLWVNRSGDPADRLPWTPEREADDLSGVPALAAEL